MSTEAAPAPAETPAAPVEGEALAEAEEAQVVEEAPVEGETVEQTPEEKAAAEAAAAEAEKAKPAAIPEDVLKAAAQKFANQTMAAARRAEARTEAVKTENTKLAADLKVHTDFVEELRTRPFAAIKRLGFATVKAFLDAGIASGGEPAEPTPADEIAALKAERAKEKAEAAQVAAQARVDAARVAVFAALDKDSKYDLVTTDVGHGMLWDAIQAYHELHGDVPDAAVFALADEVERDLEAKLAKSKKFSGQRPAETKKGDTAAAGAATAARTGGKTLDNKRTSGAPAVREYSMDPDERRRQVNEELRAEGLL